MNLPPAPPAPPEIAAYDLLDLPVAVADGMGCLLGANAAFEDFTGHAAGAARGRRLDELLCGPDTDAVMRLWLGQRLRAAQGFAPLAFCGQDAQGQPLHALLGLRSRVPAAAPAATWQVLTLQPAPAPGPALSPDARREMELARRLEMATSAAGVAIWTQDIETGAMHWDDQMRRLHGGAAAVVARTMDDYRQRYLHPEDREAASEAMRTLLLRKTGLVDLDLRIQRADGSVRRVASRTSIERGPQGWTLVGVMLDVTERHAAEARLREASERVALATRGVGIGTWETDLAADLGHWDAQMFRLRGREPRPGPVTRAERSAWVHPDDIESTHREVAEAVAEDRASNAVFRVIWPDGSVRWLASRSVPVRDELGRGVRRIGINWDVTDAYAAAQALQDKQLAERESRAKSQFLARMSHELRTPLNAVLGFTQLLLAEDGIADEALRRRHLAQILASGRQLLSLSESLLEISGLAPGEVPVAEAPAPPPPPAPVPQPERRRLLYIEDNAVNVMLVSELVARRPDLQLESAADGASGVAAALALRPELILIDMQLPDVDGHEVLRRLRADPATAAVRCIAVSANAMPEDIRQALDGGFDDYWTKPLDFRRFMAALAQMFGPPP